MVLDLLKDIANWLSSQSWFPIIDSFLAGPTSDSSISGLLDVVVFIGVVLFIIWLASHYLSRPRPKKVIKKKGKKK